MARPTGRAVRDELIDEARRFMQRSGINGFSYSDLATALAIKAPSIHHHFRHKDDLVAEVTRRYRAAFADQMATIDLSEPTTALRAYAELFDATASCDLICLCGSLAADWPHVGTDTQVEVSAWVSDQMTWLQQRVSDGIARRVFRIGDASAAAAALFHALEGATLMRRTNHRGASPSQSAATIIGLMSA